MAKITPFKGLRPVKHLAAQVATLPYDVVSVDEAREFMREPFNFYHVTRSEIDLPPYIDVYSQDVYDRAKENLDAFIKTAVLIQDAQPCYYIYELVMDGRSQTGLICGSSIEDYDNGIIKKHEFTRPEKELDRINHISTTRAETGVVFLAYNDCPSVDGIIEDWKKNNQPENDFTASDGIRHIIWVVNDATKVAAITTNFATDVPCTYIADGHHRAASAAKVCHEQSADLTTNEPINYFITCIFPASQLKIMDYNRVVKDLNGHTTESFIAALGNDFEITKAEHAIKPDHLHEFGMYIDGGWYKMVAKPGTWSEDPIGVLDVSILQQRVLDKLLDIKDPRVDKRVDFVGGIRGMGALEKRVNSKDMAAAFSLYPVTIQQLFTIANSGNVMPPKSTWFEPKLRDGLVVYMI